MNDSIQAPLQFEPDNNAILDYFKKEPDCEKILRNFAAISYQAERPELQVSFYAVLKAHREVGMQHRRKPV